MLHVCVSCLPVLVIWEGFLKQCLHAWFDKMYTVQHSTELSEGNTVMEGKQTQNPMIMGVDG